MGAWKVNTRPYNKLPLNFDQQLQLLKRRGLIVNDEPAAIHHLQTISYFRLSGYWHPFRQVSPAGGLLDELRPNTTFDQIIELYQFDRELRSLILDAIERFEVAARTQITYHLGLTYGAFGHTDPTNFHTQFVNHPKTNHRSWLTKLENETRRSKDKFIQHYKSTYTGFPRLPVWMATEILSLGSLSIFYKGLKNTDKRVVADFFNLPYKRLQDWFHTITYIRNVCAHHSRLWNRDFAISPSQIREPNWQPPITPRNDRIFFLLLMLRHLQKAIGNHDDWRDRTDQLITPIAQTSAYRSAMGIPENWMTHPLWH